MKLKYKILWTVLTLAVAGQASAATNWALTSASVSAGAYVTTSGGTSVNATGWANTGAVPASKNGNDSTPLQQQPATNNLYLYTGGLGINNLDGCGTTSSSICTGDAGDIASQAPEHAIDNNGRYEMVLLSFSQSVKLSTAKFGWTGTSDTWAGKTVGDSDYTVLAYTGTGAPALTGLTWATLGSDWAKIGNYANALDNVNNAINGGKVYSSYWLIGAYNPLAGGTSSGLTLGDDYLKLASVSGDVCTAGIGANCAPPNKTPEPGSMALFAGACMGMLGLRRRRQV